MSNFREGATAREWLAVCTFLLFLGVISIHSIIRRQERFLPVAPQITIYVYMSHEVLKELVLPYGATIADACAQLVLGDDVDLSKLMFEEKLKTGQRLLIPTKGKTTIFVTGAVDNEGVHVLPEEYTYKDLMKLLQFQQDADTAQLSRRRRKLHEGEIIHVMRKKTGSATLTGSPTAAG